jgi:hypothetical protein
MLHSHLRVDGERAQGGEQRDCQPKLIRTHGHGYTDNYDHWGLAGIVRVK